MPQRQTRHNSEPSKPKQLDPKLATLVAMALNPEPKALNPKPKLLDPQPKIVLHETLKPQTIRKHCKTPIKISR